MDKTLDVRLLERDQYAEVNPEQWDRLAEQADFPNPFYERWNLIPALRHLERDRRVVLITVHEEGRLAALFPVVVHEFGYRLICISIWKHDHCFLSDPLCHDIEDLGQVFDRVSKQLDALWFNISEHSPKVFGDRLGHWGVSSQFSRAAVKNASEPPYPIDRLPGRVRRENKRIVRRLFRELGARYITSNQVPLEDGFRLYCDLEGRGWKGSAGSAISSRPEVRDYYEEMIEAGEKQQKVCFQALLNGEYVLAISLHLLTHNTSFDVKTTYNERFKRFYPGVVLEILNLHELAEAELSFVDSCTAPDNFLINRLWPDRRIVHTTYIFPRSLLGSLIKTAYACVLWLKLNTGSV